MLVMGRVVFQGTYCLAEDYAKGRDKEEMKDAYFDGGRKSITVSEGAQASFARLSGRSSRKIKTLRCWKATRCPEKR
jgi:hypothetical protein